MLEGSGLDLMVKCWGGGKGCIIICGVDCNDMLMLMLHEKEWRHWGEGATWRHLRCTRAAL